MKKGRKCIEREIHDTPGSYSLNERPETMDYETYKQLRRIQKRLLTLYLNDPRRFIEEVTKLKQQVNDFKKKD